MMYVYIYIYTPYTIQQTPGAFRAISNGTILSNPNRWFQRHVDESQSTFFARSCIEVFVAGAVHEPTLSAVERGLGGQHFALPGTCNCFEVAGEKWARCVKLFTRVAIVNLWAIPWKILHCSAWVSRAAFISGAPFPIVWQTTFLQHLAAKALYYIYISFRYLS